MDQKQASKLPNTARTLLGLAAYRKSGRTPAFAYQNMIKLFCQTSGASNEAMSSVLAWTNRPYGLPDCNGVLGDVSVDNVEEVGDNLRVNGFHDFKQRLPEGLCDDLLRFATTAACVRRGKDGEGVDFKHDQNFQLALASLLPQGAARRG